MKVHPAEPAPGRIHQLAEGPVWDPVADRALWVDIAAGQVFEGALRDGVLLPRLLATFDHTVGAVVPAEDGGLLVVGRDTVFTLAPDGTAGEPTRVLEGSARHRLNDAACDAAGRLLVGSLALDDRAGDEVLLRLEPGGRPEVVADGLTISNGIAWSPDGRTMYHVDSGPGLVWSIGYDVGSGALGRREVIVDGSTGTPDGLCVDVDGGLWVAFWGAGEVRRLSPRGEHLATVEVPAPHTSSVAFVGPELDQLLVTTATVELADADLARWPGSGRLFLADVGTSGVPTHAWKGSTHAAHADR